MSRGILFSDVDGTLVHYPPAMKGAGELTPQMSSDGKGYIFKAAADGKEHTIVKLHPSTTGMQGLISLRTLDLMARVRKMGFKIVIISGARTSTMMQRLPFLPFADAVATENGGRIFLHDPSMINAAPYFEDAQWREIHSSVAGPADQDGVAPEDRKGLLWDVFRDFKSNGWNLDAVSYATSFRIKAKAPKTHAELEAALKNLPGDGTLAYSFNLGMADVYPVTSGKDKAAEYLMKMWGVAKADTSLLCDDDNDLKIAAVVNSVFLPTISAESMQATAEADSEKFFIAPSPFTMGTEEAIEAFINSVPANMCSIQ